MNFYLKYFVIIIPIVLSSCHEKDYDIIGEAKKLLLNSKEKENLEKIEIDKKNEIIKKEEKKENIKTKKVKKKETIKKSRILKKIEKTDRDDKDNEIKRKVKDKSQEKILENKIKKIGIMLPLSGENGKVGKMILNAIEMALFQTKASNLELVIKDTKADPKIAQNAFLDLLDRDIKFVIGPLFSKTLGAISEMVDSEKISVLALTNNTNLAKKGIWTFGVDPQEQTRRLLKIASEKDFKKTAALLPQNAYGLILFETLSNFSMNNLTDISRIEFYENTIESQQTAAKKISKGFEKYREYLNKLEEQDNTETSFEEIKKVDKPFDSVFIAASGQVLTILSSQLQYNFVDPKVIQFLGISSWEDISILNEPALDGGIYTTTSGLYHNNISKIYKKYFEIDMPKIAMIAYDLVALLNSLEADNNNFFSIDSLINKEGYIGLRGLFRLYENGKVERTYDVKQIKRKRFTVFEKAKSSF